MATKLTERAIERLSCPTGRKDALVFDTEQRGLAVRVMASGTKSYVAQYTQAGRKRRVPLGSVDAISLAAARAAAGAVLGDVAKGMDPAGQRKAAADAAKVEALRERMTLARLVGDWGRLRLVGRKARYRTEAQGVLERIFAEWWQRPAERLTRRDVVQVLDKLPPAMARSAASYGRACFTWGAARESVPGNPFLALPYQATPSRERVLSDAELVQVWKSAEAARAPFGMIVRLLMLTGQRREEVAGMDWAELSADLTTWTIPGERTKNGLASVVPLSEPAQAVLRTRLEQVRQRRRSMVFPSEGGKRPFNSWSLRKAELDKACGLTGWRLHDLRRTLATGLQRLGVRLEVTEAVLDHVGGSRAGIVGIYQRHDWAEEKRAALDGWAAHVLGCAEGKPAGRKVVPFKPAA